MKLLTIFALTELQRASVDAFAPRTSLRMATVQIKVQSSARHAVHVNLRKTGSLHQNTRQQQSTSPILLQTIVGTSIGGDGHAQQQQIVAVVPPQQLNSGAQLHIEAEFVTSLPQNISPNEALNLPYLAATCAAAFDAVGVTPQNASSKKFAVTGSGVLASFVMQVLHAWGAEHVIQITSAKQSKGGAAAQLINFTKQR